MEFDALIAAMHATSRNELYAERECACLDLKELLGYWPPSDEDQEWIVAREAEQTLRNQTLPYPPIDPFVYACRSLCLIYEMRRPT